MNEHNHYSSDSGSYKWIILFNIMITTFMAVLDATVVNTGLPVIMGTLGASINETEWILTGYMLSMATILSTAGWLSNRFGYKTIFIAALIIFTFGSFMCGSSRSIDELIIWRIFEGFGGGLLMPVGMAIVTAVFPLSQRGMALGFWAIASAASVSFGPMIGGYLVDNFNWNYIFYVNLPIGVFAIIFTMIIQKEYKLQSKLKFDFPGFILSSIFFPLFLYGLSLVNSSENPDGWNNIDVIFSMWISAITFILFVFVELNVKTPLINLRIFKDRNFTTANIVVFIFGTAMFGSTFLIPLYLQDALGYSAYQAGLFFLPVGIIQAIASPLSGKLTKFISPKIIIAIGLLMLGYSFYLNTKFSINSDYSYILTSLIIRGAGLGLMYPPLLAVSLINISKIQMAQASSLTNIIRQIGGSFGVAFFTYLLAVRKNFHSTILFESLDIDSQAYKNDLKEMANYLYSNNSATLDTAYSTAKSSIIEILDINTYIAAINDDFYIGAVIVLISLIPIVFIKTSKDNSSIKK
ncbi:MAG: DHA2 family efflux MFS transporter permease subunit [Bacteroidales bacterium]|nr:DHA2 family efflux MFS transporter permease subunit [Bacteroidales bacterium]